MTPSLATLTKKSSGSNTPAPECNWYDHPNPRFSSESLLHSLRHIRHRYESFYNIARVPPPAVGAADHNNLRRQDEATKFRRRLRKLHASLEYSVEALGLWCGRESAQCLLKKVKGQQLQGTNQPHQTYKGLRGFLRDALRAIDVYIKATCAAIAVVMDHSEDCSAEVAMENGLITPKVLMLVNCLLRYRYYREFTSKTAGEQPCCIVFVDKVLTSMVLSKILSKMGYLSFLRWRFLSGSMTTASLDTTMDWKNQKLAISEEFIINDGRKLNVDMIATNNVGEDLERLHAQQQGSCSYVILFDMPRRNKCDLRQWCGRVHNNSMSFRFIIFLQKGKQEHSEMLTELMQNQNSMRAIDAEIWREEEDGDEAMKNCGGGGGRKKKRKELHSTAIAESLAGDWLHVTTSAVGTDVTLHAYKLCFKKTTEVAPSDHDRLYADFALLVSGAIDEDILKIETTLHLANNMPNVTASIYACGTCTLSSDQLEQAKEHQQLIFDCMFGRAEESRKASSNPAEEENYAWRKQEAYLLLPLIESKGDDLDRGNGNGSSGNCSVFIDWEAVGRTAVAARMLSDIILDDGAGEGNREDDDDDDMGLCDDGGVRMACRTWASVEALQGMAVVTIHTRKMYSVLMEEEEEVSSGKTAECRMEGWKGGSYADYYAEKHNVTLKHPHQLMLDAKRARKLRNHLLVSHANAQKNYFEKKNAQNSNFEMMNKNMTRETKQQKYLCVHLPPKLCLLTGISNSMVSSLYLFPSFMHRLHALILATQLRRTIATHMPACSLVHPTLIMEALTTVRCLEGFSLEGFELLGDSFLKYTVSRDLYLRYSTEQEGKLSARRSELISNNNLHKLAMRKGLPGYIRDEAFQPDSWHAPCMRMAKSNPCRCNLDPNLRNTQKMEVEEEDGRGCMIGGKSCSEGHRWICSKTIADTVEALVGAFLVSEGGLDAATCFIKWMGIMENKMQLDDSRLATYEVEDTSLPLMAMELVATLEAQLCYAFRNRSLLLMAFTHGSHDLVASQLIFRGTSSSTYQRLEFLGDSVLDFLITRHLFITHPSLSPGLLSDLRSAAVNNQCFSRSAVKHGLHRYLCHGSSALQSQVANFVRTNQVSAHDQVFGWEGIEGPKVLGDLIESIAGAVLVDSGFDLETVWRVMLPLLSPLVTPATLPLHPIREVHELCQSRRISFRWKKIERNDDLSVAEAEVTINRDEVFSMSGAGQTSKTAKKNAAQKILSFLLSKGMIHPRRRIQEQAVIAKHVADEEEMEGSRSSVKVVAHDDSRRQDKTTLLKLAKRKRCHDDGGAEGDGPTTTKRTKHRSDLGSNVVPMMDIDCAAQPNSKATLPSKQRKKMKSRSREVECYSVERSPVRKTGRAVARRSCKEISMVKARGGGGAEEEDMEKYVRGMEEWRRGHARSVLNELCMRKKWRMPEYVEEEEGDIDNEVEGGGGFMFSAYILVPHENGGVGGGGSAAATTKCTGDPMPTKNDAKDNVATKILLALYNSTLGST